MKENGQDVVYCPGSASTVPGCFRHQMRFSCKGCGIPKRQAFVADEDLKDKNTDAVRRVMLHE